MTKQGPTLMMNEATCFTYSIYIESCIASWNYVAHDDAYIIDELVFMYCVKKNYPRQSLKLKKYFQMFFLLLFAALKMYFMEY